MDSASFFEGYFLLVRMIDLVSDRTPLEELYVICRVYEPAGRSLV